MLIVFLIVVVRRGYSKRCAEGQIDRVSSFKSLALHLDADFSDIHFPRIENLSCRSSSAE